MAREANCSFVDFKLEIILGGIFWRNRTSITKWYGWQQQLQKQHQHESTQFQNKGRFLRDFNFN